MTHEQVPPRRDSHRRLGSSSAGHSRIFGFRLSVAEDAVCIHSGTSTLSLGLHLTIAMAVGLPRLHCGMKSVALELKLGVVTPLGSNEPFPGVT